MPHAQIISQMTQNLVSEETQEKVVAAEARVDRDFRDEDLSVKLLYMQCVLLAQLLDSKVPVA